MSKKFTGGVDHIDPDDHVIKSTCARHTPKPGIAVGADPRTLVGRLVKLCFPCKIRGNEGIEAMWVHVDKFDEDLDRLEGWVSNIAIYFDPDEYCYAGRVAFAVNEIADIHPTRRAEPEPTQDQVIQRYDDFRRRYERAKSEEEVGHNHDDEDDIEEVDGDGSPPKTPDHWLH